MSYNKTHNCLFFIKSTEIVQLRRKILGEEPDEARRLYLEVIKQELNFMRSLTSYISAFHILKLNLRGRVHIGDYRLPNHEADIPFYAFRCKKHGLVTNYSVGHLKPFCPFCMYEV